MEVLRARARTALIVCGHLALVALANRFAFVLRFDGEVPAAMAAAQLQMLPWLLVVRGLLFARFGLYRGLWRYAGVWDLQNILTSVILSSGVFYVITRVMPGASGYPRSVFIVDALILAFLLGGVRLAVRLHHGGGLALPRIEKGATEQSRTVLIYGAGEAGESIVRDIRHRGLANYVPVGFVDDNRLKVGQSIHGVPVLGTRANLRVIMAEHAPDEVLIAMPAADASTVRQVVRALEPYKVHITILPNLHDILNGTVTVSQIRRLAVEDLLPRAAVGIDEAPLRQVLSGRRVMVTGAGGSIGSELCQQIVALAPEALILYERNENSLYTITNVLADRGTKTHVHSVLGDITDMEHVHRTLAQYRPEVIFHAAAHKHVPLMEAHPCEAVKNNIMGTRIVAEAAKRHGVTRFILVSTDKAVNPTSVMGATKRVAELVVMDQGRDSATAFFTVRFGNVLGSNGSAIPRFIEQIKAGGPITITHPAMKRYFMLLPEAAQLVLHVAGRGRNGGVYVLDMGEQIKVEEMARNLIRLSGYVPDEDIRIAYIGLRPGEKLFEELVGASETVSPAAIERVFEVTSHSLPSREWLNAHVRRLERLARQGNSSAVMQAIASTLPEYTGRPWDVVPVEPAVLSHPLVAGVAAGAAL